MISSYGTYIYSFSSLQYGCGGSKPEAFKGADALPGLMGSASGGEPGKTIPSGARGIQMTEDGNARIVMRKFRMSMLKEDVMGEGTLTRHLLVVTWKIGFAVWSGVSLLTTMNHCCNNSSKSLHIF